MTAVTRQCPNCKVRLTRFGSSRLWWMSSVLSGRLVQPCAECGMLLRHSSMTLVTGLASAGLVVTSVSLVLTKYPMLLTMALACAVLLLVGVLAIRVDKVPDTSRD